MNIQNLVEKYKSEIINWRRNIHQNPELGFEEVETIKFIVKVLSENGINFIKVANDKGLIASIGKGKPVIGIRADMDALPIQEETGLPFASKNPGKMHACGHDAHVAMVLGAACILADLPEKPPGEIRFIFQPSEERGDENWLSGARHIISAGQINDLDALIGLHVFPNIPAGKLGVLSGPTLASGDYFEATIKGKGGHDSQVHETIDPIFITCQVVNAIYGIRSRRLNPLRNATISINTIHAGTSGNIVPQEVKISGTIRCFDEETRQKVKNDLEKMLTISHQFDGDFELQIGTGVPVLQNDNHVAGIIRDSIISLYGEGALEEVEKLLGVDDFAWYSQIVPSAMFFLGVKPDGDNYSIHHPKFTINESALSIGSSVLVQSALNLLVEKRGA